MTMRARIKMSVACQVGEIWYRLRKTDEFKSHPGRTCENWLDNTTVEFNEVKILGVLSSDMVTEARLIPEPGPDRVVAELPRETILDKDRWVVVCRACAEAGIQEGWLELPKKKTDDQPAATQDEQG
jgi:hypothetical protein